MHVSADALQSLTDQADRLKAAGRLGDAIAVYGQAVQAAPGSGVAEHNLAAALGDKKVLMMSNHGVVTAAPTVAEAYNLLYYLERVAQVQVYAMWTGRPLKSLPQAVIDQSKVRLGSRRYGGMDHSYWHLEAMKRVLDRKDPDYKT